jgi:putative transposase
MTPSMSRKANCWDNAAMESFFKTLKVERVYQVRYETRAQARIDLVDWIEGFYNAQRMHSAIDYQVPNQLEKKLKGRIQLPSATVQVNVVRVLKNTSWGVL